MNIPKNLLEYKYGETYCTYCGKLIERKEEAILETTEKEPEQGEFQHSVCYFKKQAADLY